MTAITSNGTGGGDWSVGASWTGAAVPGEGDTVIVQNGDTITIDQNITVGADTTTAAIDIASGGKLEVLHTVAADYILTLKGNLKVSSGGTLEIGTVANPIPASRIFTIKLNYSASLAEGKYGLLNYGNMIIQGDPARITVTKCMLNADAAADATSLTTDASTGWKDNDDIAIASTSRTWSEAENGKMNGDAVGTALTVDGFGGAAGGVQYAHSGTSPTQAETINLTRNIKIASYNTSYRGYVCCYSGSTSDVDYVEFYMIGYNTTDKYGVTIKTTATDATNFAYCSVWGEATSNYNFYLYGAQNVVIDNCITYTTKRGFYIKSTTYNCTISNNIIMKVSGHYGFQIIRGDNSISGNTVTSCNWAGFRYMDQYHINTLFTNNTGHSNNWGESLDYFAGTLSNLLIWRSGSASGPGLYLANSWGVTIENFTAFGNFGKNIHIYNSKINKLDNISLNGDSSFSTPYGIYIEKSNPLIIFEDCILGEASGIKTIHSSADIYFTSNSYAEFIILNSKLSSSTKISNINNAIIGSYVQCEDLGQVQYADKAWYKYGIVIRDSTTKKTNTYSTRFDYLWAADDWLEYEVKIPVKDGESVVVSAWLRKNSSYTSANRPKIKLSGMGITETEDQMSDVTDTWEKVTVSGTPTRTGLAKLTIMIYLTNAGASAWIDFDTTGVTQPVLNTLTGDFWADGHFSTILFDTGTITPAEFWKTLTADVDEAGSFANLLKDYIDAAISGRAPANEYDTEMTYIPSNLGDVPTAAELIAAHGSGAWTAADISALATAAALSTHDAKLTTVKTKTDTINWDDITSLIDEIGGKWEIIGNQMIFYKSDNVTEIMRFNLFDSGGSPAMEDVYKRERV